MNQADQDQAAWSASQPKPTTLSAAALASRLAAAGIAPDRISMFDDSYRMLTPEYITGPLATAFADFLLKTQIKWTEDTFDCNSFSISACMLARLAWAVDKRSAEESAPAFGVIGFPLHMICVGVHNEGVKFYEPQPGAVPGQAVFREICLQEVQIPRDQLERCLACIFI